MTEAARPGPSDEAQLLADRVFANPAVVADIEQYVFERLRNPDSKSMSREDFRALFH